MSESYRPPRRILRPLTASKADIESTLKRLSKDMATFGRAAAKIPGFRGSPAYWVAVQGQAESFELLAIIYIQRFPDELPALLRYLHKLDDAVAQRNT